MYDHNQGKIALIQTSRTTTISQVELVYREAVAQKLHAVTVPPLFVKKARELLANSDVQITTVIGFPYGYSPIEAKVAEAVLAIVDGATELELTININALMNDDWQYLARELSSILPIVQKQQTVLTVVLEASLMAEAQLLKCSDLYGAAGVQYCCIGTGTEPSLPAIETVALMRKHLADNVGVKVNGPFATATDRKLYFAAGASYLGVHYAVK